MKSILYGSLMLIFCVSVNAQEKNYSDADCKNGVQMMRDGANKCLGIKDFDQRAKCFDDISRPVEQKYGNEFFEGPKCRPGMDGLKQEVMAKEKANFPDQGSAIEANKGNDHGPGGGDHGPGGNHGPGNGNRKTYSAAECKDGTNMMRQGANKCLGMKNFDQRAKCFDDISRPVSQKYGHDFFEGPSCRPGMDALKQEVMAKEKAKFADQGSAIEANKGNNHGPGMNHGPGGPGMNHGPGGPGRNHGPGGPGGHHGPGNGNRKSYSAAECKAGTSMMRQGANNCLNLRNFDKRAKCFDDISRPVSQKYGHDFFEGPSCRPGMDALKQEVLAKEKQKFPKQGSALEANKGNNHGPGGNHGPGNRNRRSYSEAECKQGVKMMRKGANRCLKRKNFDKRARCFDKISKPVSKKLGHDFFESSSCRPGMDALKAEVMAKEKQKYPKQGSAIEAHRGDNRGGDNNGPGNMNFSEADCKAGAAKMEKRANKCLKRKKFSKRKKCMDNVHHPVKKKYGNGFFEGPSCRPVLDALKQKVIAQEKAKFPNQPSALADGGGDRNRGGDHRNDGGKRSFSEADCKKGVGLMEKKANKCLKRKKFARRKKCMDNVHMPAKKRFGNEFFEGPSCRPMLDQLKQKIKGQEKSKYPKQESALDD
ncbi:hypothetical protein N9N67_07735, partial [Bacteriovoracaceae bacterium]|nr:hypothetical protein [Bacteriovoracaceae bacterium]